MTAVKAEDVKAEVLSATGQVLVPLPRAKKKRARAGKDGDERADRIEAVERELYERNLEVLRDASYFGDIPPEALKNSTPPQAWIDQLGIDEATRRFVIAKGAMASTKEAPAGLGVAKYIVGAFAKAKASVNRAPTLNVTLISMAQGPKLLPSIEIEEGGK